jgi:hypothetical protein
LSRKHDALLCSYLRKQRTNATFNLEDEEKEDDEYSLVGERERERERECERTDTVRQTDGPQLPTPIRNHKIYVPTLLLSRQC